MYHLLKLFKFFFFLKEKIGWKFPSLFEQNITFFQKKNMFVCFFLVYFYCGCNSLFLLISEDWICFLIAEFLFNLCL